MAQTEYLTPTTALQAVNRMLEAIGQAPIASLLAADTNVDAELALNILYDSSREIQQEGWHFNQEMEYVIDPNEDTGEITLPSSTLRVWRIYGAGLGGDDKDLVVRGNRLYDRIGHTFNIGLSVKVDLTIALPFDQLPQPFRTWVNIRAVRRFTAGKTVSSTAVSFTSEDEKIAWRAAEQHDAETDQRPLYINPHIRRMRRR